MRASVLVVLVLVGCGESGGGPGDAASCPPTIDGGVLLGSNPAACAYTCTSDASAACSVVDYDGGRATQVCTSLRSDARNCGMCGTVCLRTRDQGGALDGICEGGRCR